MIWNSPGEFLAMGGYALYVWGCVGATALLLACEPLLLRARHREALAELAREIAARREGE
jgi:heme exporter protein D